MKKIFTILFLIFAFHIVYSQNRLSTDELLINSTIMIESSGKRIDSKKIVNTRSSGTSFIFCFRTLSGKMIPVVVTNKHIVQNADQFILYFKLKDSLGFPIFGKTEKVSISNFNNIWITHPDSTVDLAICPLMPIINDYKIKTGKELYFFGLPEEIIPSDSLKKTLMAIEDVIMIGYPYGLRDTINDMPVVRKGITATPISLNYNSKREFLIDLPVFPGSSGSPILIYNHGSWNSKNSSRMGLSNRVILVGINFATYSKNFDGIIMPEVITNVGDPLRVQTSIPLYNIGIIIKAERLLDFKPFFKNVE